MKTLGKETKTDPFAKPTSLDDIKKNVASFGASVKGTVQDMKLGEKLSSVGSSLQSMGSGLQSMGSSFHKSVANIDWKKLDLRQYRFFQVLGRGIGGFFRWVWNTLVRICSAIAAWLKSLKKPDLTAIDEFEERISPYLPTEMLAAWLRKYRPVKLDTKKHFVLDWTQVYGWRDDPFKQEILKPFNQYYIVDKQMKNRINLFLIKKQRFGTIIGESGTGKTSLALWLVEELRPHAGHVFVSYINGQDTYKSEADLVQQILKPVTSMYEKVITQVHQDVPMEKLVSFIHEKIGNKPLVLILDDPDKLPEKYMQLFVSLYQAQSIFVQLLLVTSPEGFKKTLFSGRDYKDTLKILLKDVPEDTLLWMLRKRIESVDGHEIFPFDERSVKAIAKKVNGNPHDFLRFCREKALKVSLDERDKIIEKRAEIQRLKKVEEVKRKENKQKLREQQLQNSSVGTVLTKLQNVTQYKSFKESVAGMFKQPSGKATEVSNPDAVQLDQIDKMLSTALDSAFERDQKKQAASDDGRAMNENDSLVSSVASSSKRDEESQKPRVSKEMKQTEEEIESLIAATEKSAKKKR